MVSTMRPSIKERERARVGDSRNPKDRSDTVVEGEAEEKPSQPAEINVTAELVLHPFNNAVQALWLCEKLKGELQAEILYVAKSHEGTIIKVSLRKQVSLVDFLKALNEVAEAWEESVTTEVRHRSAAAHVTSRAKGAGEPSVVVCVALKP